MATLSHEKASNDAWQPTESKTTAHALSNALLASLQDPVYVAQLLIKSCCNCCIVQRESAAFHGCAAPVALDKLCLRTVNDVVQELDEASLHRPQQQPHEQILPSGSATCTSSLETSSNESNPPRMIDAKSKPTILQEDLKSCQQQFEATQSALQLAQEIVGCLQMEYEKYQPTGDDGSSRVFKPLRHGFPKPKAPVQTNSSCFGCKRAFSTFHRSRHCSSCGFACCHHCTSRRRRLPRAFGFADQQVHVCGKCYSWFDRALDRLFVPSKKTSRPRSTPEASPSGFHGPGTPPVSPSPGANEHEASKPLTSSRSSSCSSSSGACSTPPVKTIGDVSCPPPLELGGDSGSGANANTENDNHRDNYCSSDDDDDDDQQPEAVSADEVRMKSVSMEEIARSLEKSQSFAAGSSPALDKLANKRKLLRKKTRAASFDFVDLKSPASPSSFLHVDLKSPSSDAASIKSYGDHNADSSTSGGGEAASRSAVSSPVGSLGDCSEKDAPSPDKDDSQGHKQHLDKRHHGHHGQQHHHHHHRHSQPHSATKKPRSGPHSDPTLRKTCFDDSDIVLDKMADRNSSSDESEEFLVSPTARYFQRFPVYDLRKGATKDQPATLKRVFMGFSKRNPLLDRYTVEVDGLRGMVLVKSVFMHRFWSFRCDSLREMAQLNNPPASLRCLVINCGEKDRILEWQFVSDKEREEFQRAIEETKRWLSSLRECNEESIEQTATTSSSDCVGGTGSRAPDLRQCGSGSTHGCPCDPPPSITTIAVPDPSIDSRSPPQIDERRSGSWSEARSYAPSSSPSQSLALKMRSIQWHLGEQEIEGVAWTTTLLVGPASTAPPEKLRDDASFIWARVRGIFSVTNYRVVFMPFEKGHVPFRPSSIDGSVAYIPLFAINSVQKMLLGGGGNNNSPAVTLSAVSGSALAASVVDVAPTSSRGSRSNRGADSSGSNSQLLITCKDVRMMRLEIDGTPSVSEEKAQMLYTVITKMADRCQRYGSASTLSASSPRTSLAEAGEPKVKQSDPSQLVSGAFAMTFKGFLPLDDRQNGWDLFHDEQEFKRQVAPKQSAMKKTASGTWYSGKKFGSRSLGDKSATSNSDDDVCPFFTLYQNDQGEICPSYPAMLLLPSCVRPSTVAKVASFRAKNRLPVITWFHRRNRCVLTRSSQPLLGNFMKLVSNPAALSDQSLVGVYRRLPEILKSHDFNAQSSRPIYIFDARKQKASAGNRLMGKGGVETPQDYPNAVICHLNIANMYKMQSSFLALMKLTLPGGAANDEKSWLSSIESTRWLEHVRLVLEGALKIARVLELEGSSALVHCSDGWDRTSQVVSLAQLMIDPYYRTIEGFAVLVEKDWCAFGHKFAERLGGDRNKDPTRAKSSPVMLQFLDCVWQIWRQFHAAFEFNERFLLHLANATTSGLYGTFLYDSRLQRATNNIPSTTVSVWTPVLQNREHFSNPHYTPWDSPTWPWTGCQMVRLWEGFFFQWHPRYFDCGWISTLVHYGPVPEEEVVLTEEEQKRMAAGASPARKVMSPSLAGIPVPLVVVHGSSKRNKSPSSPQSQAQKNSKRSFFVFKN